jgi:hypothetical protein
MVFDGDRPRQRGSGDFASDSVECLCPLVTGHPDALKFGFEIADSLSGRRLAVAKVGNPRFGESIRD